MNGTRWDRKEKIMTTLQERVAPDRRRPLLRWSSALAVTALAVICAVAVRAFASATGIDIEVRSGDAHRSVGYVPVVLGSGIAAVSGAIVLRFAVARFAAGRRWWTIGALVFLPVSLTSPLEATTWQAWLMLTLMHLVTGAVVIIGLRRLSA